MKFTTAAPVEQLVWEMRLADYPRALNRSQMNALANGAPPYTDQEQRQNQINTNVNFLDYTELLVDARRQLEGGFSGDRLFTVNLDGVTDRVTDVVTDKRCKIANVYGHCDACDG